MIDMTLIQQQFTNGWLAVIGYLPNLLGGILFFLVGRWLARLVRQLLVRLGERIEFDRIIEGTGLTQGLRQAQIKQTPTELLSTFLYWLIYLNVIVLALRILGLTAVTEPLEQLVAYLPNILRALITLIVGALIAQFVGRLVQAATASMGIDFHQAVGQTVRILLMVMTVILAIDQLGLDVTLLTDMMSNILTIIVAGLALAFGLGARTIAQNVLAGFYARDVFKAGDVVVLDEREGVLMGIGSTNSEISFGEERLIIPNTRLTEASVKIKDELSEG